MIVRLNLRDNPQNFHVVEMHFPRQIVLETDNASILSCIFMNIQFDRCITFHANVGHFYCSYCTFIQVSSNVKGAAININRVNTVSSMQTNNVSLKSVCFYHTKTTKNVHCAIISAAKIDLLQVTSSSCGEHGKEVNFGLYSLEERIKEMNITECKTGHGLLWVNECSSFDLSFSVIMHSSSDVNYLIGTLDDTTIFSNNIFFNCSSPSFFVYLMKASSVMLNYCSITSCNLKHGTFIFLDNAVGDITGSNNFFSDFKSNGDCSHLSYQSDDVTIDISLILVESCYYDVNSKCNEKTFNLKTLMNLSILINNYLLKEELACSNKRE